MLTILTTTGVTITPHTTVDRVFTSLQKDTPVLTTFVLTMHTHTT